MTAVLLSGLLGLIATGTGATVTALWQRRFAKNAGALVQTAEQREGKRLLEEAKTEADALIDEAKAEAAQVIAAADERNARTETEQRKWHKEQVAMMQEELAILRKLRDRKVR